MSEKIEVGDVFTFDEGDTHYTCDKVQDSLVHADGCWFSPYACHLIRKADPYHGVTLPEPPAGYRLAKWGEVYDQRALWWCGSKWKGFGSGTVFKVNDWAGVSSPKWSIFAIPLDQPASQPPKSWQFRHDPWVPKRPETLEDVPEGVDVSCSLLRNHNACYVVLRRGSKAYYRWGDGSEEYSSHHPNCWLFIRYLDPPTQKPMSLDDVPDGRCVMSGHPTDNKGYIWRSDGVWLRCYEDGSILRTVEPLVFTITDYIAEFR